MWDYRAIKQEQYEPAQVKSGKRAVATAKRLGRVVIRISDYKARNAIYAKA